jgi:hypothetical protein
MVDVKEWDSKFERRLRMQAALPNIEAGFFVARRRADREEKFHNRSEK